MKKTLKVLLLVAFMAIVLFTLTGCGNKLVATKETEDAEMGIIKEKYEYTFKKDKMDSVKATFTFEDKEKSEEAEKQLNELKKFAEAFAEEDFEMEVKRSGKKVTMEIDASTFASIEGEDVEVSKDELREQLEEEGYKVK